ncbi:amino acid ABC transporter ATP-binding protein [Bosea psychrotolerans]|uniref:Amino acid ABC transporter ATP-binding protein (PAAT family) n=1 Tax=Bosea psychrotolerans TaxID=1871628 RepID=A0A2S4MCL5_9HYPH|nr:amino acid ABC transporter ATP-binding protein [Bosea psychrotolerans]POR52500.1 amino acid ABC transporter ATP-binding protein (PAAT family) [Bosea psychrotolerans]
MTAQRPLLELIGIEKSFGQLQALKTCSLEVQEKETVVLIGPSGSGKSTLLRCVNLLEPPDRGNILFKGKDIGRDLRAAPLIRQEIGMVFQNFELFQHLSAAENIMLAPMKVLGLSRLDAHDIALGLLRKVRIPDKADSYPDELSGGQQQRVAIARALAMKPAVMLYDEPTSALDPEMIREVLDVMAELSAEGMTSIVVTHEMGFAKRAADRIVFMEAGQIVEIANSADFFGGTVNARARQFLDQILH